MKLSRQQCTACEGGVDAYSLTQAQTMLEQVPGWQLVENEPMRIERTFKFKDFIQAIDFVNKIAEIAEHQGHHPDIAISWNRVTLTLYTHAIGGLSINDYIVAARINELEN